MYCDIPKSRLWVSIMRGHGHSHLVLHKCYIILENQKQRGYPNNIIFAAQARDVLPWCPYSIMVTLCFVISINLVDVLHLLPSSSKRIYQKPPNILLTLNLCVACDCSDLMFIHITGGRIFMLPKDHSY